MLNHCYEILGVLSSDVLLFVFRAPIIRPHTHYVPKTKRTTKVNLRNKDTKKIHLSKHYIYMKSEMFCVKIFQTCYCLFLEPSHNEASHSLYSTDKKNNNGRRTCKKLPRQKKSPDLRTCKKLPRWNKSPDLPILQTLILLRLHLCK